MTARVNFPHPCEIEDELCHDVVSIRYFEGSTVQIAAQFGIARNPGATGLQRSDQLPSGWTGRPAQSLGSHARRETAIANRASRQGTSQRSPAPSRDPDRILTKRLTVWAASTASRQTLAFSPTMYRGPGEASWEGVDLGRTLGRRSGGPESNRRRPAWEADYAALCREAL
jgi:hypothetical protein